MQVLIYQGITASRMKQVEYGNSCCKARSSARGGMEAFILQKFFWKEGCTSSEYSVIHHILTFLSASGPPGRFIPYFGQRKKGLGASISWETKRLWGNVICIRAVSGNSPSCWCSVQLIVWLVLLAWCERGGWGAASEGFWESCGTAWTLSAKTMEEETARSLHAHLARAGKAAALSWSWWSL